MTNEEMAVCIKAGETGLLETLWLNVEKIIRLYANRYFNAKRNICLASCVDCEDLYQVGYFALLDAVKYYDNRKGYKFTTYLTLPLKKHFSKLISKNVSSVSLDELTPEGYHNISETLADEAAEAEIENALDRVYTSSLSHDIETCLAMISPMQAQALKDYCRGYSMSKVAKLQKSSKATVQMKISRGLANLQKGQAWSILNQYKVA